MTTITTEPVVPVIDKWKLFDLLGYKVHHGAVRNFHNSKARVKVASAPRRSTKSYSAAKDALATVLMPNTRTWIVGPSYGLAEKEFRYIHEDLVLRRKEIGLPKPTICLTNARSGQLYIKFPWGAIVEGKSADNPDSLLGEAVDLVIYSEAAQLPRQIRERYVQPTVITKKGTEIVPTTPDQGGEWVHELVEKAETGEYPEIEAFSWDVTANPSYDMAEFNRAKKFYGADSPVFREQYMGEWVFYAGRVYGVFNETNHVIEPFSIPRDWPVVRGIDFGHRDPFVCLYCAVGPSHELYFFQEYYCREGKGLREHVARIKADSRTYRMSLTVGDPSSAQAIEDMCYEGIPIIGGNNDREAGRMRVLEYLNPTEDGIPPWTKRDLPVSFQRKWPRMYFFNTLKETLREFKYFRWREQAQREGEKERTEGEDHAMDTMRYIIMTRPSPYKMSPRISRNSFSGMLNFMRKDRQDGQFLGHRE